MIINLKIFTDRFYIAKENEKNITLISYTTLSEPLSVYKHNFIDVDNDRYVLDDYSYPTIGTSSSTSSTYFNMNYLSPTSIIVKPSKKYRKSNDFMYESDYDIIAWNDFRTNDLFLYLNFIGGNALKLIESIQKSITLYSEERK